MNLEWPIIQNGHFSKSPIFKITNSWNIFSWKFHWLVLGLVVCFCSYVRQPQGHIGWATSMPFASFNPTNPSTNLWNFREKISRIGDFEKWPFWKIGHFEFFFLKKKFFFCFILMKISPNMYGRLDGSKFWCFPWFPGNSLLCVI